MDSSYLGTYFLNPHKLGERRDSLSPKVSAQPTLYILDRSPAGEICENYLVSTSTEKITFSRFGCMVLFWIKLSVRPD